MKKMMWAVAAALAVPAAAQADVPTHCAPSDPAGVFACASFAVSFDPVTGVITVKVQNNDVWAADAGINPLGHWYGISGFGIQSPAITGASWGGAPTTEGAAAAFGTNPGDSWDFTTNVDGFTVEAGGDATGINGSIFGCNGTAGGKGFTTCDGAVNSGWVVFTFNTTMTEWDASSAMIAMRAQGGAWSYRCADEAVPNGELCTPPTNTVPEPMSVLLMATGLLGVGGIGLRRRRRNLIDA